MKVLVTGGFGFIGSNLVLKLVKDHKVINIDNMTYAANPHNLEHILNDDNHIHYPVSICDYDSVQSIIAKYQPDVCFHLAAESHVDNSIESSNSFVTTNITGTHILLEAFADYVKENKNFKFIHISTDEVFGSLEKDDSSFTEKSRYRPNSPYSATKAGSDLLVRSWVRTYGFPAIITNCCNNYGPRQHMEKFIPKAIISLLSDEKIPVYGNGQNIREWIHVDDHVTALETILHKGQLGQQYLIGSGYEKSNHDIAIMLGKLMNIPDPIHYVSDRPGHDFRYSVDNRKLCELGWSPKVDFDIGLEETIAWYRERYIRVFNLTFA